MTGGGLKHNPGIPSRPLAGYARFQQRLAGLAKQTDGIGWGYGDYVGDVVGDLTDLGDDVDERPEP